MKDLNSIMSRVLGIPLDHIHDQLTRDGTPEWDSFNHLMLVSEVEKNMGIRLSMAEIESIKTYDNLIRIVQKKI